jgi:hypothetical protein
MSDELHFTLCKMQDPRFKLRDRRLIIVPVPVDDGTTPGLYGVDPL